MAAMALASTAPGDPAVEAPGDVTMTPEPSDFAQDGGAPAAEPEPPEAVAVPGELEPPGLHPVTAVRTRTAAEQDTRTARFLINTGDSSVRRFRLLRGNLLPFRPRVPRNRPARPRGVMGSRELAEPVPYGPDGDRRRRPAVARQAVPPRTAAPRTQPPRTGAAAPRGARRTSAGCRWKPLAASGRNRLGAARRATGAASTRPRRAARRSARPPGSSSPATGAPRVAAARRARAAA